MKGSFCDYGHSRRPYGVRGGLGGAGGRGGAGTSRRAPPALTDLVQRLLGRQLRQPGAPHDVAADAHACLDLALYEHQKGPTPPLEPPASAVRMQPPLPILRSLCARVPMRSHLCR